MEQASMLRVLVELSERKAELEKQLDEIKKQIASVQGDVLDYMQDNGMQSVNLDGHTVYLRRDIYAKTVESEDALQLARDHGYGDAVRTLINAQTASSIVREIIKPLAPDEPVPEWVIGAFSWTDKVTPTVCKS